MISIFQLGIAALFDENAGFLPKRRIEQSLG